MSPGQTRFCSRIFVFGQFRFPLITLLSHIGSRLSRDYATSQSTPGPMGGDAVHGFGRAVSERRMAFRAQTIRSRTTLVTVVTTVVQ